MQQAPAHSLIWDLLILPLAASPVEVPRGASRATLTFEPPPRPEGASDSARQLYARVRLRRDGPSGLEDLQEFDGGLLGFEYPGDSEPATAPDLRRRLTAVAERWRGIAHARLGLWLDGSLDAVSVWPVGAYDAGIRCAHEDEAPSLARPPAPLPRGLDDGAPLRLIDGPGGPDGMAWSLGVGDWTFTACPETSQYGLGALLIRPPDGEDVPVVLDDQIELVQGPGVPEPRLRALLHWLHGAAAAPLAEAGAIPEAGWLLFRDRYRRSEPLDWSSDPGIVCSEPFEPLDLAARSREAVDRFVTEMLGVV